MTRGNGIDVDGISKTLTVLEETKQNISSDSWVVGTNAEYAVYVEFGTSSMAAQPYMRPAVNKVMRKADLLVEKSDDAEELVEQIALEIEAEAKDTVPVDTGNLKRSIEAEPQ